MYVLKGFAQNASLITNTPGVVSSFGELSSIATTYSREVGHYTNPSLPLLSLKTFYSKVDGTETPANEIVFNATNAAALTLAIMDWIYETATTGQATEPTQFMLMLQQAFPQEISQIEMGEVVENGGNYYPTWVTWVFSELDAGDNLVKIWFSSTAFEAEYDEYEISVVPPISNLNDFFMAAQVVKATLAARTMGDNIEAINLIRGVNPETLLVSEMFPYINPLNPADHTPTYWTLVVYGAAGNNIDIIKDTLVEYILANSTHTREEWEVILPDIFKRTEFVIVPQWDNFAIPDQSLTAGVGSSMAETKDLLTWMAGKVAFYAQSHIQQYLTLMATVYRMFNVLVIGGPDNRDAKYLLRDLFPDYIAVASTSFDFGRMTENTRNWSGKLLQAMTLANTAGWHTYLPTGYSRVTREGRLWVVFSHQNVNYLVLAKLTK